VATDKTPEVESEGVDVGVRRAVPNAEHAEGENIELRGAEVPEYGAELVAPQGFENEAPNVPENAINRTPSPDGHGSIDLDAQVTAPNAPEALPGDVPGRPGWTAPR
jgi:hypothetical protein